MHKDGFHSIFIWVSMIFKLSLRFLVWSFSIGVGDRGAGGLQPSQRLKNLQKSA